MDVRLDQRRRWTTYYARLAEAGPRAARRSAGGRTARRCWRRSTGRRATTARAIARLEHQLDSRATSQRDPLRRAGELILDPPGRARRRAPPADVDGERIELDPTLSRERKRAGVLCALPQGARSRRARAASCSRRPASSRRTWPTCARWSRLPTRWTPFGRCAARSAPRPARRGRGAERNADPKVRARTARRRSARLGGAGRHQRRGQRRVTFDLGAAPTTCGCTPGACPARTSSCAATARRRPTPSSSAPPSSPPGTRPPAQAAPSRSTSPRGAT